MDLHSILRRFLYRNPNQMGDKIFGADDDQRHERRNVPEYENDFSDFEEHMHMFNEMKDMFESMFRSPFGMVIRFPNFDDQIPYKKSPRSIMLKDEEESQPSDSVFCKENLKKDLTPYQEEGERCRKSNFFSYSKFSSVRTVHLPDGRQDFKKALNDLIFFYNNLKGQTCPIQTVEEHRTVIDNDGNKVTTVRRIIGDTSHEITTKSDVQGIKEKEENFLNMDEGELFNFEQKWKELWSEDPVEPATPSLVIPPLNPFPSDELFNFEKKVKQDPVEPASVPTIGIPPSNPSYWYLIKKFFGSSEGDNIKWC